MKGRKVKKSRSPAVRILFGGLTAALCAIAIAMLLALLMVNQIIPQDMVQTLSAATAALAAFFASALTISQDREDRFLIGPGCAAVLFTLTILAKWILFPGESQGIWINAASCLAGGLLASLLIGKPKRNAKRAGRW